MGGEIFSPKGREPDPQNAMERLLKKGVVDPSVHGEFFRRLWGSELAVLVPYHPEIMEGFTVQNGDTVTFTILKDEKGEFVPVYTSERAAEFAVRSQRMTPVPAIAVTAAEVIFRAALAGRTRVRLNAGLAVTMDLPVEGLEDLVAGDYTQAKPDASQPRERMTVVPVPAERLHPKLRQAVRVFCVRRPVPVAVYVFHRREGEDGPVDESRYLFCLWLRSMDNDFYNDFSVLVGRLMPDGTEAVLSVVTSGQDANLEYLKTCTPLWPVLPRHAG